MILSCRDLSNRTDSRAEKPALSCRIRILSLRTYQRYRPHMRLLPEQTLPWPRHVGGSGGGRLPFTPVEDPTEGVSYMMCLGLSLVGDWMLSWAECPERGVEKNW